MQKNKSTTMIDTTTQIHQIEDIFNVGIPFLYKKV